MTQKDRLKFNLQLFGGDDPNATQEPKNDPNAKNEPKDDPNAGGQKGNPADGQGGTTKTPEELEKEFQKKLQSEVDRRVSEALKKQEEKLRKEQEERERLAKLTEEERRREEEEKRAREIAEKERQIVAKELRLELVDILASEEMDIGFKDLIPVDTLVGIETPEERTQELTKQVQRVKAIFNELVEKKVAEVKQEFLKGATPTGVGNPKNTPTPSDPYEVAKKQGNVRAMLSAKFANRQ